MKGRTIKYYLVLWFMIILSGVYLGISFFSTSSYADTQLPSVDNPIAGLEPDDDIQEGEDGDSGSSEAVVLPDDPIDLINYALNIYNKGAGSSSTFTYIVENKGSFQGMALTAVQNITGNIYRSGSESLEEAYFYYDNVPQIIVDNQLVKKEYRAINVDTDKDEVIAVGTKDFDLNSRTYNLNSSSAYKKTYTVEKAVSTYKVIYSMEFPLEINKNTVNVTSNDTRTSKYYYIISVSYKLEKLPRFLNDYYLANSSLQAATYSKYNFTFVINKSNGRLKRLIREENFITYGLWGTVKVDSKATFQQDFNVMDKEIEVRKPYLDFIEEPKDSNVSEPPEVADKNNAEQQMDGDTDKIVIDDKPE